MSSVRALVKQHERHLLLEGPAKDVVIVTLHHDEEERDMASLSCPVSVQVDPGAQFVSIPTGVERLAVERQGATGRSLTPAPLILTDLPDEDAVIIGRFHALETKAELSQADVVDANCTVMVGKLLLDGNWKKRQNGEQLVSQQEQWSHGIR